MTASSYNATQLIDRTLYADGDSVFDADKLISLIHRYDVKFVDRINDIVKQYNDNVPKNEAITVKQSVRQLDPHWTIPDKYKNLDIDEYLHQRLIDTNANVSDEEFDQRAIRLFTEMKIYKEMNMVDVLQTIVYVVDTLTQNKIVWGIGRGSSVSSYVLFLIGLHDVDSYAYDLDINDFLRR